MYTTTKKSKMISQLELDTSSPKQPNRVRDPLLVQGRVVVLCLTTWYFGYVFCEMSPLSPTQVLGPVFGNFMTLERGIGPCFGLIPLGAAVGVIISNLIIDMMSRRLYLVLLNIINLGVTAVIQSGDVYTLYIFRIFQGVLVGNFMTLIPTYISEITPKQLGSRFGVYPQISVVLGVLTAFVLGVIFTDSFNITNAGSLQPWQREVTWRIILIVPAIPSLLQLFFIVIGYIPESPYSLIVKNRREQARQVLSIFYQQSFVDQMLEQRQSAIFNHKSEMEQHKVSWTRKGYYIGIMLSVMQVLSGIASFVTQAGHVMAYTFGQTQIGLYTPVLITISQLVGTFVSVPMLKYFQWRKMTIIGGFSLAFFDGMIGMLFYLFEEYKDPNNPPGVLTNSQNYVLIISCISIMAFMFTFGATLGSSVWSYIGFMMPPNGVTVALVVNWTLAGCSIIAFSFVTQEMESPYVMMWIYCGITFILSIVFSAISIDIKGLSVRKVQLQLQ